MESHNWDLFGLPEKRNKADGPESCQSGTFHDYQQKKPGAITKGRLSDLECSYLKAKKQLNQLESRKDVYLAVWKSFPFGFITLFSTILYTYSFASSLGFNADLVIIPMLLSIILLTISGICWVWSKVFDQRIAEQQVSLEAVRSQINDRVAGINSAFIAYYEILKNNPLASRTFPIRPENWSNQSTAMSKFGEDRLADMSHRYNTLMHTITEFEGITGDYVQTVSSFSREARKKVIGIQGMIPFYFTMIQSIMDRESLVSFMTQFLFRKMTEGIAYDMMEDPLTIRDTMRKYSNQNDVDNYTKNMWDLLFSKDGEPYRALVDDPTLKELAKEINEKYEVGMKLYEQVRGKILYCFILERPGIA